MDPLNYSFGRSRASLALTLRSTPAPGFGEPSQVSHSFGPIAGPLAPVGSCGALGEARVARSGELLVAETCPDKSSRLVLQSLDGARRVVWSAPPDGPWAIGVQGLEVRDGHAAFVTGRLADNGQLSDPTRVVLMRLSGGAELRSIAGARAVTLGDGGDALVRLAGQRCAGALFRAGEAQPRQLATSCPDRQLSGTRLVFAEKGGGGLERIVSEGPGGVRQTIVGFGATVGPWQADGQSLAYASPACDGLLRVRVVALDAAVTRATARRCPIRLLSHRLRVVRGHVRVLLECPRGCTASLSLRRGGREIATQARGRFRQRARRRRHAPELSDRAALRVLSRSGRVHATLRLGRSEAADAGRRRIDYPVVLFR